MIIRHIITIHQVIVMVHLLVDIVVVMDHLPFIHHHYREDTLLHRWMIVVIGAVVEDEIIIIMVVIMVITMIYLQEVEEVDIQVLDQVIIVTIMDHILLHMRRSRKNTKHLVEVMIVLAIALVEEHHTSLLSLQVDLLLVLLVPFLHLVQ